MRVIVNVWQQPHLGRKSRTNPLYMGAPEDRCKLVNLTLTRTRHATKYVPGSACHNVTSNACIHVVLEYRMRSMNRHGLAHTLCLRDRQVQHARARTHRRLTSSIGSDASRGGRHRTRWSATWNRRARRPGGGTGTHEAADTKSSCDQPPRAVSNRTRSESSSNRASQRQIRSQKCRMLSPKTLTCGFVTVILALTRTSGAALTTPVMPKEGGTDGPGQ